jgi:hypothetical protein
MAIGNTTIETNNKLIRFTKEINREFVRENLFSPYMSTDMNAIIRVRNELKSGGEVMNIPFVKRLKNVGVGSGPLVGFEEKIDNYGMRFKVDWARNAVVVTNAEKQKDSADIFGEAKPLLSEWGKSRQRDDIIKALMAFPTTTLPAADITVNGTLYAAAEAGQATAANAWLVANADRVQYGALRVNGVSGVHATGLATLDITNDKFTAANLSLLKRVALNADPHIRPYKTKDGYEYYVVFCGTNTFRDLKLDLQTVNKDARPRSESNVIFQDGDQIYDGVIVRQVPEISNFVSSSWTGLTTAGTTSNRTEPVFLCGQQAVALGWGQMARPTFRKEDDYDFIQGTGIDMCFGVVKMYSFHTGAPGNSLVQSGVVTGFYSSSAD